jgi:MtN3 and saliva related transmembrane protein
MTGLAASACTSLSYLPQVRKAWPRGSTDNLSWKTLAVLTVGLCLWIAYGFIRGDWLIIGANCIGAGLSACVLAFKIRDLRAVSVPPASERGMRAATFGGKK